MPTKYLLLIILILLVAGCSPSIELKDQKRIEEMENSLKYELLNAWYPISLDTVYGGFLSDFTYDWQAYGPQNKMLVTQSRHVWTASQAAMFYEEDSYLRIAEQGFYFLRDKMWDKTYGGFYMLRDRKGESIPLIYGDEKRVYGSSFAIYALTTYFSMSGDSSALNLAKKTFLWIDRYNHDSEYKGYFDHTTRDGSWQVKNGLKTVAFDSITIGYKDFNSSIHLLESFTALYKVWPDSMLRERLLEMFFLIRDVMIHEKGYLILYWTRDWKPVSFRDSSDAVRKKNYYLDHVSFGHDVETAYLLLEASHVLGLPSDIRTLELAKKMVDHALIKGWDNKKGGFYYDGYYFDNAGSFSIINEEKSWWVQAEGLNTLLLMAKLFPQEKKYYHTFKKQWEYINKYLIDHKHGGWYVSGLDKSPGERKGDKAFIWKANYHDMRALINCIKMLNSEYDLVQAH
jgi:mannobiose 2-epimerase